MFSKKHQLSFRPEHCSCHKAKKELSTGKFNRYAHVALQIFVHVESCGKGVHQLAQELVELGSILLSFNCRILNNVRSMHIYEATTCCWRSSASSAACGCLAVYWQHSEVRMLSKASSAANRSIAGSS
jgi:hypothetical protein